MGMYWVLFDPHKETQSKKLTTIEAQCAISRLKRKYINSYLIWKEDWAQWKKLNEFLRSPYSPFKNTYNIIANKETACDRVATLVMNDVDAHVALKIHSTVSKINTNVVETKDLVEKSKKQFDGDDLTSTNTDVILNLNFSSLRNSTAFLKRNTEDKYKIELLLIHTHGHIFRTTAKDISLTGTYNERIVPHIFHNCVFELIIINNLMPNEQDKRVRLKSRIISNDGVLYIEYINANPTQINLLRKILKEYLEKYQTITG